MKVWDPRTVRNCRATPVGIFAGHKDGISHVESKVYKLDNGQLE